MMNAYDKKGGKLFVTFLSKPKKNTKERPKLSFFFIILGVSCPY
jgi:hypothetical protein